MTNIVFIAEAYKQSMLETTYVVVIDTKNLLDTLDEVRIQLQPSGKGFDLRLSDDEKTTDTAVESQSSNKESVDEDEIKKAFSIDYQPKEKEDKKEKEQIYVNDSVEAN